MKKIKVTDLDIDFNENTEPKDDTLMEMLKLAYTHQITCVDAMVPAKFVQPFSDYEPKISAAYRKHFNAALKAERLPKLYVYESSGVFIMSDDYAAYHLYKEKGYKSLPCVIIGVHSDAHLEQYLSEPYYLPPPEVEVIN